MSRLDELRTMRDFIDREILAELEPTSPNVRGLVNEAALLYGVPVIDLLGGSRDRQVCRARQAAAWLLRRSGMSYPEIGRVLGVDHTTAIYGFRKVENAPAVRALLVKVEAAA